MSKCSRCQNDFTPLVRKSCTMMGGGGARAARARGRSKDGCEFILLYAPRGLADDHVPLKINTPKVQKSL